MKRTRQKSTMRRRIPARTMRTPARTLLVLLIVFFVIAGGSPASATTSTVRSLPNGDVEVTVSAGALTDKDRDGDFNTARKGDLASLFFAVDNLSSSTQTIRIDYVLDGPGTQADQAFTREVVLEPGGIHQDRFELKIQQRVTPPGSYSLTVTGTGTETATAVATFTVN
jgi:hypothetical protein